MTLEEALAKAGQILDEERVTPTVDYKVDLGMMPSSPVVGEYDRVVQSMTAFTLAMEQARSGSSLPVQENPRQFIFKSENYVLLATLHSLVGTKIRHAFAVGLLLRVGRAAPPACRVSSRVRSYSHWEGWTSELPLIAEFCVRTGHTTLLVKAIADGQLTPGFAILLHHIGQMVALNYTIFSEAQYSNLTRSVQSVIRDTTSIPNSVNQMDFAGRSIYVNA